MINISRRALVAGAAASIAAPALLRAQTQPGAGQPGKTPGGKVAYLLNFYILKPVNLNQVDRKLNGYRQDDV